MILGAAELGTLSAQLGVIPDPAVDVPQCYWTPGYWAGNYWVPGYWCGSLTLAFDPVVAKLVGRYETTITVEARYAPVIAVVGIYDPSDTAEGVYDG